MRNNQPVTQRDIELPDDAILMSITDTDGRIVFANRAFVRISGYTTDEMLGQPHNLVRHPDVPREVFADMWATLKAGRSWSGLLENRCKNGDHYWVRANATPVHSDGKVTGFASVRTQPQPGEAEAVEELYRSIREDRLKSVKFDKGVVIRTSSFDRMSPLKRLSIRSRIRLACATAVVLSTPLVILAAGVAGNPLEIIAILMAVVAGTAAVSLALETQVAEPLDRLLEQAQTAEIPNGTTAVTAPRPELPAAPDLRDRLVTTATTHGLSSTEYRAARDQLVTALTTTS